jgi:hypothetical protein
LLYSPEGPTLAKDSREIDVEEVADFLLEALMLDASIDDLFILGIASFHRGALCFAESVAWSDL